MFSFDTTSFITLSKAFCETTQRHAHAVVVAGEAIKVDRHIFKAPLQGEHAHIWIGLLVIELSLEVPDFMAALFS
ncbi:hypothetical protein N7471_007635 [Penicillium samsonianum]|uniref:uncharacterized protein n=1 Tax=Penicillium samsonianum TaxID=1882272 RepID=UPI002548C30E|nr:uncharacterized protein N7471_007635 [Penicillium samsonianum]KAJ6132420.1 hypothetical protein N7471_007635 [Penicillium samsonianum]